MEISKIDCDFSDSGAQDSWLTPFSLRILNGITTIIGNLDSTIGKGTPKVWIWRCGKNVVRNVVILPQILPHFTTIENLDFTTILPHFYHSGKKDTA